MLEGTLWDQPGVPSLVVRYGVENDYYFNPACSVLVQLWAEFKQKNQFILQTLALIVLVSQFYLSLVLRGHYFIDNFGGVIIGYQIWWASNRHLSYYVDKKLLGMTLHERFHEEIRTKCGNCKLPINEWVQAER